MDADASVFFGTAFSAGTVTEQTLWAGALIALAVLACTPNRRPGSPSATSDELGVIAPDRSDVTYV